MGFAIIKDGVWTGDYASHAASLSLLGEGESVVECEWDAANDRPVGVTMPEPEPVPDWSAFSTGVNSLSFYASKILLGAASNLFPALVHNVETKNTARVGQLLSLMITAYNLTTAEVAEFQQLLDDCNINITLQGP